jgi:hypothetical protein
MRMIKVGNKVINLEHVSMTNRGVDGRLYVCFAGDGDDVITLEGDEADAFEAFVANEAHDIIGEHGPAGEAPR